MKIFISHTHDEQLLAKAWKTLFEDLGTSIEAWYSSDPSGGIGSGRWRDKVVKELQEADIVFGLFTPESKTRPWIYFECAFAMGMDEGKEIIPIIYYMSNDALPSPLQNLQIFQGEESISLKKLYRILIEQYKGKPVKEKILDLVLQDYLEQVEIHNRQRLAKGLFHDHFHTYDTAKKLDGEWFAKWTQIQKDGEEAIFEMDTLKIWTTEDRLRVVGKGMKGGLYPMEGIVSSKGHVALSYWSQGGVPICGTTLLELIGGNRIMEGTWEGFTAKSLDERLSLVKGRVVIGRDKSKVEDYWGLKPGSTA